MPPRIPVRFPWASRVPLTPANGALRTFTTTPSTQALGPQSPNYIDVPKSVQPSYPPKPYSKGHLPIPRDIFKTRSSQPKESTTFLESSTPSPKELKTPGPYDKNGPYRLYKQRLADARKSALRSGVTELHARKQASDAAHLAKIQRIGAYRRKVAMAPPREVDVLTQTSIPKGLREFLADKLPTSAKVTISAGRRSAYEKRVQAQQGVRQARLHDLYTNARSFIVSEEQLDEAIDKAFGTDTAPMGWDIRGVMAPNAEGMSPWHGPLPEGVGDMVEKLKGGEGVGLAKERVRKVAEVLTGGKM